MIARLSTIFDVQNISLILEVEYVERAFGLNNLLTVVSQASSVSVLFKLFANNKGKKAKYQGSEKKKVNEKLLPIFSFEGDFKTNKKEHCKKKD